MKVQSNASAVRFTKKAFHEEEKVWENRVAPLPSAIVRTFAFLL
jgi:hypothetical protein